MTMNLAWETERMADALGARRQAGGGWMARCPAHADNTPSLKIDVGETLPLLFCHAGCETPHVIEILKARGIWPEMDKPETKPKSRANPHIVATYDYADEEHNLLYQVVRFEPKDFRQRRPKVPNPQKPSDWEWGLGTTRRVLYRLPDIVRADADKPVFVVEGEKDADRLVAEGLIATTAPMGAKKWRNEYSECLRGRNVVVIADNDEPGKVHAQMVAKSLRGIAKQVQVLSFRDLPPGGDVSDWLEAGGNAEKLLAHANRPTPVDRSRIIGAPELLSLHLPDIRWAIEEILPEGAALFVGKTKMGKSMAAMGLGIAVASGGYAFGKLRAQAGPVLYLALEDNERRLQSRLRQMLQGQPAPANLEFVLEWPRLGEGCLEKLREWLGEHPGARMVIVDTLKMIRSQPDGRQSVYDRDYESVQGLHELAGEFQVAIHILHHTRKADAEDPFDLVSGSNGLGAAADTVWVFQRNRTENVATLFLGGREVETGSSVLTWDPLLLSWSLQGDEESYRLTAERQEIVRAITETGEPMTAKDIAGALEKNFYTVRNILIRMERDALVTKVGSRYTLGEASNLRVITARNPHNATSVGTTGTTADLPHGDAKNLYLPTVEGVGTGVVQTGTGRTTVYHDRTTPVPTAENRDFRHGDGENAAPVPTVPTTVWEHMEDEDEEGDDEELF